MPPNATSIGAWLHERVDGWAPLVVVVAAVIVGFLLQRLVLTALYEHAKRRGWIVWQLVFEATRGVVVILSAAVGIYLGLLLFPFRPDEEQAANRALAVMVTWAVTVVVARIAVRLVAKYGEYSKTPGKTASLFGTVTSAVVYVIGALVVLQYLGIDIAPMLTALGVGGLAVGLALRDTLANFFSGLQIIASRRLRVGDYVRLESGREGFVSDITWLQTTIRDPGNALIVVPNEKLVTGIFTNLSVPTEQTLVELSVNVAYGNDLELVESQTREVAADIAQEFAPQAASPAVRVLDSSETGVKLGVFFHVSRPWDLPRARDEFYKRLFKRYQQQGIALARQPWAVKSEEDAVVPPSAWTLSQTAEPKKEL